MQLLKYLKLLVFVLLIASLAIWLLNIFSIWKVDYEFPFGSFVIFLWGFGIVMQYLDKSEITVATAVTFKAGNYNEPSRLLGLLFGVLFILLSIYGYLTGWDGLN